MFCYGGWRKILGEKVWEDEMKDIEWLIGNFELWSNDFWIVNFCILFKVSEKNFWVVFNLWKMFLLVVICMDWLFICVCMEIIDNVFC